MQNKLNDNGNNIINETYKEQSEINKILYTFLPESFVNSYPKFHILCVILGLFIMIVLYSLNQINYNKDDLFSEIKMNIILLIFLPYIHILWLIFKMAQHILILL